MIKMTLGQLEEILNGKLDPKYWDIKFKGVTIDSRDIVEGKLFIPLKGEKVDGHNFIEQVINSGGFSLSQKTMEGPIVVVEDTELALQELARYYAEKVNPFTIAISGSNGKTSVKDMMASILSEFKKTHKTQGNYNNHLGVPLTVLEMDEDTQYAVIEMGISDFKEMDLLSSIIRPDIGIITNATEAHLDDLGTRENVARAKMEMIDNFKGKGPFIYCKDDSALDNVAKDLKINKKSYGLDENSDYKISNVELFENFSRFRLNSQEFTVPFIGSHQVLNAAGAISIGIEMGLDIGKIREGLKKTELTSMRNEMILGEDFSIINDSYKSNPSSLKSALETLYRMDGYDQKIVVIGDMLGIGDDVEYYHREIGKIIDEDEVDIVIGIGYYSEYIIWEAEDRFDKGRLFHFEEKPDDIGDFIRGKIKAKSLILVKGSRPLELDTIVEDLLEDK